MQLISLDKAVLYNGLDEASYVFISSIWRQGCQMYKFNFLSVTPI